MKKLPDMCVYHLLQFLQHITSASWFFTAAFKLKFTIPLLDIWWHESAATAGTNKLPRLTSANTSEKLRQ